MANHPQVLGQKVTPEVRDQQQAEAEHIISARKQLQDEFFNTRAAKLGALHAAHSSDSDNRPDPQTNEGDENDEPTAEELQAEADALAASKAQQTPETQEDPVFTRNGVSKKLSEWEADLNSTFEQANSVLSQNKQTVQQAEVDDTELDEIVEAVQGGSAEQTKAALKKVIQKSATAASQTAAVERVKNEAMRLMGAVLDENKDLAAVPMIYARVQQIEKQLGTKVFVANDPARDAEARFREAWKVTRAEYDKVAGITRTQNEIDETNGKKQRIPHPSSSTTRTAGRTGNVAKVLSERESRAEAIAAMNKQRSALRN